jgi:hypothetical protein
VLKPYLSVKLPPGLYRNGTVYQSKGRYYDSDLVRFHQGTIKPIGGWRTPYGYTGSALAGVPRSLYSYRSDAGAPVVGVGTTTKLYVVSDGLSYDITPAGFTTFRVDGGFATGGTYGAGPYGAGVYGTGSVTPRVVNPDTWSLDNFGQYMIAVPTSDRNLYLWSGSTAVVAALVPWSAMTWTGSVVTSGVTAGGATSILLTATTLTGTLVVGETFTIGVTKYTVITANATAVANIVTVAVSPSVPAGGYGAGTAVTGHTNQAPSCFGAFVTPEFIVSAIGADGIGRRVRWSDQARISIWSPLAANQAGSFDLASRGMLLAGRRGKDQSLLWTDCDMWTQSYTGDQFVYRFSQAGDNCGAIGPNAMIVNDGRAMWMSNNGQFYRYDGFVQQVPCEVSDAVFSDFTQTNGYKTYAMHFPQFGEIWWLYCSSSSTECNRVVGYNYNENHWILHKNVQRNAGLCSGATTYSWMVDSTGNLYEHEVPGINYRGGFTPYLESGPVELASGDRLMTIDGAVPDDKTVGDVQFKLYAAMYPDAAETLLGPFAAASPTYFRAKARQVRIRYEEVVNGDWRVGDLRLSVKEGSRR